MTRPFFFKGLFFAGLLLPALASADLILTPNVSGLKETPEKNTVNTLKEGIQNLPEPLDQDQAKNFYLYSDETVYKSVAPFGYFDPKIQKTLNKKDEHWQLDYKIDPGPKTYIESVDLKITGEGKEEEKLRKLIENPPLKKGQVFLSEFYDNFKTKLLAKANSLGYIKAAFTEHRVLINKRKKTAEIFLTLDTGPRYYFGETSFSPNPLKASFLERFANFGPGRPYNPTELTQFQSDLTDSGYFRSVVANPKIDESGKSHVIPIDVKLKPKPKQQYILGGGYGTDTGPRLTFGSDWRYVNSNGDRFNTLVRVSQVQKTASAKYIFPGKHPLTDQYFLNGTVQTNTLNQGNSQLRQVGGGYTLTRGSWQRTFNLNYQLEHYNFFDSPYRTSHLLLPGISLQNIKTNNPIFPTEGHRITISGLASKQSFGSDTSLAQTKISGKWIHSFNENNMIVTRGDFGYTAIHNINMLPLTLNYFAGGTQTVRGYGYNFMGPGRYLIVASAEYRYRIVEKWYLATFMDMGNAFNNWPNAPHSGLKSNLGAIYQILNRGAGFGVVWNSPVGPMELTLAQAVTSPGKPNRVQFNMGTDL